MSVPTIADISMAVHVCVSTSAHPLLLLGQPPALLCCG